MLRVVEPLSPDVIVDLYMPRQDGIQVIAALRQGGVTAPIIAISGGGSIRFTKKLAKKAPGFFGRLSRQTVSRPSISGLLAKYAPQERVS